MIELSARNISKRFRNRTLFAGVDFNACSGDVVAVTGSNGSGKSTFLKILGGMLRPSAGEVVLQINGEKVPSEEHSLSTGYVAPAVGVYHALSGRENLSFLRSFYVDTRVSEDDLLDMVGLGDAGSRPVGEYSSGMIQRIKIACALVGQPPVLLLDEPYSNLDEKGVSVVNSVVDHQRSGHGIVIVATNISEYARRCDREINIEDFSPVRV